MRILILTAPLPNVWSPRCEPSIAFRAEDIRVIRQLARLSFPLGLHLTIVGLRLSPTGQPNHLSVTGVHRARCCPEGGPASLRAPVVTCATWGLFLDVLIPQRSQLRVALKRAETVRDCLSMPTSGMPSQLLVQLGKRQWPVSLANADCWHASCASGDYGRQDPNRHQGPSIRGRNAPRRCRRVSAV